MPDEATQAPETANVAPNPKPKQARKPRKATQKRIDWRPAFLAALARSGIVLAAAEAAGIDRVTAYRERDKNEAFGAAWDAAIDESADRLEAEARRRATIVGSDRLLMAMLKAYRPERYGDRSKVELSGGLAVDNAEAIRRIRQALVDVLGPGHPELLQALEERLNSDS